LGAMLVSHPRRAAHRSPSRDVGRSAAARRSNPCGKPRDEVSYHGHQRQGHVGSPS
jgi:hypothetical protein